MLDGFGLYPVCLQIDLDSYEGDWRHVVRFRNRTGWLLVAEAEIWVGDDHLATMPLIVGCDEWDEPIPSFIASNLLRCASSLPQVCDEFPPAILDELMERERGEVRKRWMRESIAAIAKIHEEGERTIRELEEGVDAQLQASDRLIADLGRRRRMLPLEHPGRSAFAEAIADQEDWQRGTIDWLADRRQALRDHFEAQEHKASRGLRPRLVVELLYVVNWHHAANPADEALDAWGDAIRSTQHWPPMGHAKLELSGDQLEILATISGHPRGTVSPNGSTQPDEVDQPDEPRHRLEVDWAAFSESLDLSAAPSPVAKPEPRQPADISGGPAGTKRANQAEPRQLLLPDIGEDLRARRAVLAAKAEALEIKGDKFFAGSRKFIANRQERDRVARQLASLDRRIAKANEVAPKAATDGGQAKGDLEHEQHAHLTEEEIRVDQQPSDHKDRVARVLNLEALLEQHPPYTGDWLRLKELLAEAREGLGSADGM